VAKIFPKFLVLEIWQFFREKKWNISMECYIYMFIFSHYFAEISQPHKKKLVELACAFSCLTENRNYLQTGWMLLG
jgi:hypothetical protein